MRRTYWRSDSEAWLNGDTPVMGGGNGHFAPGYNPICIAGPQMNNKIMRMLNTMAPLTPEHLAIVHAGTTWVPLALEKAETYLWLTPFGMMENVCLEPEEVWERHPLIVSFDGWERPVARMPDVSGAKAAWGSRYPHHDASAPSDAVAMLQANGVDDATVERMSGSAAELFGIEVAAPV